MIVDYSYGTSHRRITDIVVLKLQPAVTGPLLFHSFIHLFNGLDGFEIEADFTIKRNEDRHV